jgi:hypothetical protein
VRLCCSHHTAQASQHRQQEQCSLTRQKIRHTLAPPLHPICTTELSAGCKQENAHLVQKQTAGQEDFKRPGNRGLHNSVIFIFYSTARREVSIVCQRSVPTVLRWVPIHTRTVDLNIPTDTDILQSYSTHSTACISKHNSEFRLHGYHNNQQLFCWI